MSPSFFALSSRTGGKMMMRLDGEVPTQAIGVADEEQCR